MIPLLLWQDLYEHLIRLAIRPEVLVILDAQTNSYNWTQTLLAWMNG